VRTGALRRESDMTIGFISKLQRPGGRRLRPPPLACARKRNRTRRSNGRVSLMPSDETGDWPEYRATKQGTVPNIRSKYDELCSAVGTGLSARPPHRSVRAELPHTAPTLGHNASRCLTYPGQPTRRFRPTLCPARRRLSRIPLGHQPFLPPVRSPTDLATRPTVDGGLPVPLFRLRGGVTVPP